MSSTRSVIATAKMPSLRASIRDFVSPWGDASSVLIGKVGGSAGRSALPAQPSRDVLDVPMDIVQSVWAVQYLKSWGFVDETGTSPAGIPVVVTEMVKTGVRHRSALSRFLHSNTQIECGTRGDAAPSRDDAGTSSKRIRHAHGTFMWVGRQPLNDATHRPLHQRVHGVHWSHPLQVAVCARMKIGPTDRGCFPVFTAPLGSLRL